MKPIVCSMLFSVLMLQGQTRHPSALSEAKGRPPAASFRESSRPRPHSALLDPYDRVFPDILAGGGWETLITFVNMSGAPSRFTLTFYDDNGDPLRVPLTNSDGSISRFASVDFTMDGNSSQELVVANADSSVAYAWAYLSFPRGSAPIAGMAVVRTYDSAGKIANETTETLSNIQDFDFFAPYDNLQGVATGLIVLNPAADTTAMVQIVALDSNGNELVRDHIRLPAGARTTIMLPDSYQALAGTSGKLRVTGDINQLSAIVFRISPAGSMAYSPIFNWTGMFQ